MADEVAVQQNSLIPADMIVQSKYGDDATFEGMSGSGFLPRIQLAESSSRLVQKGAVKQGSYVMVRGKESIVKDFGDQVSCLVLGWRPKALWIDASNNAKAFFNPRTQGFQDVEKKAEQKPRVKGALYGPEYLVYVPDVNEIATMHFSNVTMRMRAGEMKSRIGGAATLRIENIEKNGNFWHGPIITGCSTPLALPAPDSPEAQTLRERFKVQMEKFANPPDEEAEAVEEPEAVAAAAAGNPDRPR